MNTQTATPSALFGSNIIVAPTNSLVPVKELDPKFTQQIAQITANYNLTKIDDQTVVLFASERQKAANTALDGILAEVTKENSPILFELFQQLKRGVDEVDLDQLDTEIRASINKKWWHNIFDSVGLSSVAKRLEKANDKIGSMLTSKSTSLMAITKQMEANISKEVGELITNSKRLDKLAAEFRENIVQFDISIRAGKLILEEGKQESTRRTELAKNSNDPLELEAAKRFAEKVDMFEARLLVIETIYTKAPVELESIRLTQAAALQTLGETANAALSEFSNIKSVLIKLAGAHKIQSVQSINNERRKLNEKLENYGTNLLGTVAANAAAAQGKNRVDDATKLLDFATKITTISKTVDEERKQNQVRYAEARNKLGEVKKLMGTTDVIDI